MNRLLSFLTLCFLTILFSCSEKKDSIKTSQLRIATAEDPTSLDPRLVRDLSSTTLMHMLYEGLMRVNNDGKIVLGLAENVKISEDNKTYTFFLRNANWSDGSKVTAHDFEETWKSILSPNLVAPNAYQLYLIKNAKLAKEGKISSDEIGVKALDEKTLIVELNEPTPYFLEMTACHFFFPVNKELKREADQKALDNVIGNGPFKIASWNKRNSIVLDKNLNYWDSNAVPLDHVELVVLDENTALQLFKSGEIDWAGSPLSTLPQDAILNLKSKGDLSISDGAGTHFVRTNVERAPFDNVKFRKAFALAVDRQSIVDHVLQGNQQPAIGLVPPSFQFGARSYFKDHDLATAKELFNEALKEANLEKTPKITLRYAANERNHKIAQSLQQQWNKAFNISMDLEASELQTYLDKIKAKDYFLALGSWYADIEDSINFLEVFKSKDNPTNQTGWQDDEYTQLLTLSSQKTDTSERLKTLKLADEKFIDAMPIIPLYHSAYNYLKKSNVEGVYFSPLGYLDFKYAKIIDSE